MSRHSKPCILSYGGMLRLVAFLFLINSASGMLKAQNPEPQSKTPLVLDGGVNPANLGKGDWIWQLPQSEASLGLADGDVQGVVDFEKSQGMRWLSVKCGASTNIFSQFTSNLVVQIHNAGMKAFAWAPIFGSNDVQNEINVALNALNLGADGFIMLTDINYTGAAQRTNAVNYCQGIRAVYPSRFLAHSPAEDVSFRTNFPLVEFGTNCDVAMPQVFWADFGIANNMTAALGNMDKAWGDWQKSLTGNATNAIKPLVPIAQGYNPVRGTVDGTQISIFMSALTNDTTPATPGGYKGVGFWSCQDHSVAPNKWPAIAAATIGDIIPPSPAQFQLPTVLPNRTLRFTGTGEVGATYYIEASSDFMNWSPLATMIASNGIFSFTVDPTTNGPQRYYRARSGP